MTGASYAPTTKASRVQATSLAQAPKIQAPAARLLRSAAYIVDQVVRAHGGSVAVPSDREAGTSFTVRLPRER